MGFPFYVAYIVAVFIAALAVVVSVTENRHILGTLFMFYVIAVLIITLFVRTYDLEIKTILDPFMKYRALAKDFSKSGWKCFLNHNGFASEIFLNILLFVPLGFLVPKLQENFQKGWKMLLLGLAFSLFIEISQLVLHMGCFDISDLVHNTLGSGIGYAVWHKWMREE
ncbi:MAG: VanZ family protein [Clostridiales bacterium]|nr:VanZ family protein [Clostridiales bacterium]